MNTIPDGLKMGKYNPEHMKLKYNIMKLDRESLIVGAAASLCFGLWYLIVGGYWTP